MLDNQRIEKHSFSFLFSKVVRFFALAIFCLTLFTGIYLSRSYAIKIDEESRQKSLQNIAESISQAVMSYTHICDAIAASDNILKCANPETTYAYAAFYANSIQAEISQIVSVSTVERSQMALFFLNKHIIVTPSQYYLGTSYSTFSSYFYNDGLTMDMISEHLDKNVWNTFCVGNRSWLVRTICIDENPEAFIVLELDLPNIFAASDGEIVFIGNDTECVYSNLLGVTNAQYNQVLENTSKSRNFTIDNKNYTFSKNVFSNVGLNILVGLPYKLINREFIVNVLWLIIIIVLVILTTLIVHKYEAIDYYDGDEAAADIISAPLDSFGLGLLLQGVLKSTDKKTESMTKQCLTAIGINPENDYFVIGLSYLEDSQGLFQASEHHGNQSNENIIPQFVLNNLLQDLLFDKRMGALGAIDDYYIALAERYDQESSAYISEICDRLTTFCIENLGISLAVTQPILTSGNGLKDAVEHTLSEISHHDFWRYSEKNTAPNNSNESSEIFFKLLDKMHKCFENEKFDEASSIFDDMLENYLPTDTRSISIAKNRVNIMFDMLVSVSGAQINEGAVELMDLDNITDFRNASKKLFSDLIHRQKMDTINLPSQSRINNIKDYVYDHLSDNDLSVSTIADHFGLNMTYLSRIFKENTGVNLLEYIQRTRVSAAKELLRTESVKDASINTGFGDMQSFVRVFKKYEGITPAEYKRLLTQTDH